MVNYHQKKGKGKLPIFFGNRERVIPVYAVESIEIYTSNGGSPINFIWYYTPVGGSPYDSV